MMRQTLFSLLTGFALVFASAVSAQDDNILLTVSTEEAGADNGAAFTLAELEAFPAAEFTTTTIWTEGDQVFVGVALKGLLEHIGITSGNIEARAINDYAVNIPMDSLEDNAPMIAYRQNGDTMSRRDKGPLWIVYPYDEAAKYRSESIYSRSIWQLDRLHISR